MGELLTFNRSDQAEYEAFKNPRNWSYRFFRFWISYRLRDYARGNPGILPGDEKIREITTQTVEDCFQFMRDEMARIERERQ